MIRCSNRIFFPSFVHWKISTRTHDKSKSSARGYAATSRAHPLHHSQGGFQIILPALRTITVQITKVLQQDHSPTTPDLRMSGVNSDRVPATVATVRVPTIPERAAPKWNLEAAILVPAVLRHHVAKEPATTLRSNAIDAIRRGIYHPIQNAPNIHLNKVALNSMHSNLLRMMSHWMVHWKTQPTRWTIR